MNKREVLKSDNIQKTPKTNILAIILILFLFLVFGGIIAIIIGSVPGIGVLVSIFFKIFSWDLSVELFLIINWATTALIIGSLISILIPKSLPRWNILLTLVAIIPIFSYFLSMAGMSDSMGKESISRWFWVVIPPLFYAIGVIISYLISKRTKQSIEKTQKNITKSQIILIPLISFVCGGIFIIILTFITMSTMMMFAETDSLEVMESMIATIAIVSIAILSIIFFILGIFIKRFLPKHFPKWGIFLTIPLPMYQFISSITSSSSGQVTIENLFYSFIPIIAYLTGLFVGYKKTNKKIETHLY